MRIEKGRNRIFNLTLSGFELAALISSARLVAEGAQGELTAEAVIQLKQVLANYDNATIKLKEHSQETTNI
jgi:hypothetical protein